MSTVLVYSDDPRVRERVLLAVGRRPDPDLGPIEWVEAGDMPRVDLEMLAVSIVGMGFQVATHLVEGDPPDVRLHHHARPAAERRVVNGVVHVGGPLPQVVDPEIDVAARAGLPDQ